MESGASSTGENSASVVYLQDSDIWMHDGNIVISAVDKDKTTTHLFRCHRSVLEKHSSVFRDLFMLPQGNAIEQYEGVPLVKLPDDSADVKGLLAMLYDPSLVPVINNDSRNWKSHLERILGPLRLSGKFELTNLRNHLVGILAVLWPSRIKDWDERQRLLKAQKWDFDKPPAEQRRPIPVSLIVQVIIVAHEVDAMSVLPAAYYELHTACIIDRTLTYYDMDVPGIEKVLDTTYSFYSLLGGLPAPLLCHIMEGRESFRVLSIKMTTEVIWKHQEEGPYEDCTGGDECSITDWWAYRRMDYDREMFDRLMFGDPLKWLANLREELHLHDEDSSWSNCYSCRSHLGWLINGAREYLWGMVPILFRLETKESLESRDLPVYCYSDYLCGDAPV